MCTSTVFDQLDETNQNQLTNLRKWWMLISTWGDLAFVLLLPISVHRCLFICTCYLSAVGQLSYVLDSYAEVEYQLDSYADVEYQLDSFAHL